MIKPLFSTLSESDKMGNTMLALNTDDYNKELKTVFIHAENDAQAISSFLKEYTDSPKTLRSYSKEIERLLLWCIHVANKNISSLRRDDFIEYQKFLKRPSPKKLWCGPKVPRKNKNGSYNENWRPFVKGLGNSSVDIIIKILDSFFNYLVQTRYLIGNPLVIDKRRKKRNQAKTKIIDRYLELDELEAVFSGLYDYPANSENEVFKTIRARYIILLLFYTGIRLSESSNHGMKHFIKREERWFLRVIGKGKKLREVPIPDPLLDALAEFRLSVGLSPEPKFRDTVPLIPMKNLKDPISSRRIDQILRWAFELGARIFENTDPRKASKLRQASAHWLRHSYVTCLLESGAPLKVAQENAGHANIGTTLHYCHIKQTDRHEATQALSLFLREKGNNKRCQQ